MNEGYKIFGLEAEVINKVYPELIFNSEGKYEAAYLSGKILLSDDVGGIIDRYEVDIVPTPDYPLRYPFVYETADRLPHNFDWHVHQDGHWCINSIPEEIFTCKSGLTLIKFIENQVKPFLFNQKFRELNGYFLRELPHGVEGNIIFFKETFKTENMDLILKGLNLIKQRKEPNRVSACFCGSGKKYRKCHRAAFRKLSVFNDRELDLFIKLGSEYKLYKIFS